MADKKTQPKKQRAIHRPITVNVTGVTELPTVRELPQETEMTVNLKMDREMWLKVRAEGDRQIEKGEFVDFVAITIQGIA